MKNLGIIFTNHNMLFVHIGMMMNVQTIDEEMSSIRILN